MEYIKHYYSKEQRNNLANTANSNGFRMLHDDFPEDWERRDEPHGTLVFTDELAPQATVEPEMDYKTEILKLQEANITLTDRMDKLKVA